MSDTGDVTRPRWFCPATGDVEHCRDTDRSPDRAKRALLKRLPKGSTVEYRAGVLFRPGLDTAR